MDESKQKDGSCKRYLFGNNKLKTQLLFIIGIILIASLVIAPLMQNGLAISKTDKKARDKIEKAITRAVEGKWSKIDLVQISKTGSSDVVTVYNTTKPLPPIPPPPANVPPVAKILSSKLVANVSDNIDLSAEESKDPDGQIVKYYWTGVNVTNRTAITTNFTFPNVTKVLVGLTVTDNKNASASANLEITNWTAPTEPPNPPPNVTYTKIDFTGDVKGTGVKNAIANDDPDLVVVLGDLGYQSSLSWFKDTYGKTFKEKLKCLIGNHDSTEDGSSSIYKEAKAYCGEHWYTKVANGTTLIVGFNSNGDKKAETNYIIGLMQDSAIMQDVKNLIITSHKNGHVPPNSHHPAEAASVYTAVENAKVDDDLTLIEVGGHNHVLAANWNANYYISGAGGKSHYECGTNTGWEFCNNDDYGFMQLQINDNTGDYSIVFYDTQGNPIN